MQFGEYNLSENMNGEVLYFWTTNMTRGYCYFKQFVAIGIREEFVRYTGYDRILA